MTHIQTVQLIFYALTLSMLLYVVIQAIKLFINKE